MSHKQTLLNKMKNRQAQIGLVGAGYAGLPLGIAFAEAGFSVTALDVDRRKVELLNRGVSYIEDIPSSRINALVTAGKLFASFDYEDLRGMDAIIICVPTPLRQTKDPDMSYIIQAVGDVAKIAHDGMLVVLESTTYPGTTHEIVAPELINNGMTVGEDIFIAFSPERVDPGNKDYGIQNTPKVVGGISAACTEVATALYETAIDLVVPVSSPTTAEMVKLLENTFRAVNIALVNEMALMCDKLGLDAWEIIQAAATKPFGFMPFYPGPGLGGHCIPVDPHYLSWKLKTLNYNARFIELASEINTSMPLYVVDKIMNALNDDAKAVRGSNILVLGVAYKPDVDDVRESPALDVLELLRQKGANAQFHDPYVSELRVESETILECTPLSEQLLQDTDCVVVITHHSSYDWQMVLDNSRVVVDTRHVTPAYDGAARIVLL